MERIEIPATTYWQATDGKRFTSQEDCARWESLYPKWTNPVRYRELENVDGTLCFAYWTETKEDFSELIWFAHHKHNQATHNCVRIGEQYRPQWIILSPEYDDYGVMLAIRSIEEFRDEVDYTKKAAEDTLSEVVKLIWEKA